MPPSGMMGWDMRVALCGLCRALAGPVGGKRSPGLLAQAEQTTLAQYREWLSLRDAALAQLAALRNTYDAILMPAASGPAPKGFAFSGSRSFQVPWSFMGAPTWSIPGPSVAGLPFGVQIAGFVGGDDVLVGHAAWLEQSLATKNERRQQASKRKPQASALAHTKHDWQFHNISRAMTQTQITEAAAHFAESLRFGDTSEAAVKIARFCVIDGVGLIIDGSDEHSVQILTEQACLQGGTAEVALPGAQSVKVPASCSSAGL